MDPYIAEILRDIHRRLDRLEQREHRTRRSTPVGSKSHHVKKLDSDSVPVATLTQNCLKCHGFGHSIHECPTEDLIAATPEETATIDEEDNGPIWDEELIQEPQLHEEELSFNDDYQHVPFDDPIIELIGGPRFDPEYNTDELPKNVAVILNQGSTVMSIDFHPSQPTLHLVGINVDDVAVREFVMIHTLMSHADLKTMTTPLPPRENDRVVHSKVRSKLGPVWAIEDPGPPRADWRKIRAPPWAGLARFKAPFGVPWGPHGPVFIKG